MNSNIKYSARQMALDRSWNAKNLPIDIYEIAKNLNIEIRTNLINF